jgi:hypothetical protein
LKKFGGARAPPVLCPCLTSSYPNHSGLLFAGRKTLTHTLEIPLPDTIRAIAHARQVPWPLNYRGIAWNQLKSMWYNFNMFKERGKHFCQIYSHIT